VNTMTELKCGQSEIVILRLFDDGALRLLHNSTHKQLASMGYASLDAALP